MQSSQTNRQSLQRLARILTVSGASLSLVGMALLVVLAEKLIGGVVIATGLVELAASIALRLRAQSLPD